MQSPNHRATWTDEETEVLIRLWEENLGGLRGQKRNGKIYESMTAALARCGIVKTRAQVHSKMENLRSKYRCHTKNRTTGSGGVPWRFYWKLHKFLGTLPANDASLAVESSCGELSVSEIVRSMETGQSGEELDLWTTYELPVEVPSPQTVEIEEGALGDLVGQPPATQACSDQPSPSRCSPARSAAGQKKRSRDSVLGDVVQEQKSFRMSWLDLKTQELELYKKQLKLQEESGKRDTQLIEVLKDFYSR
ncbi:hypothetical protein HPB49_025159 [Dermacentor silvarum]|uniref:Uncharacterized protein n=1 Tax=Dermacentor silvarum TaxID=543639 RepID=A0ACB8DHI3_DERSI|nr:hypothetical protein HPB49_025159 [Dermacentor silvarum]